MPTAVPHTATFALTNATFPYLLEPANKGLERACTEALRPARGLQHLSRIRDAPRRRRIARPHVEGTGDGAVASAPRSSRATGVTRTEEQACALPRVWTAPP